MKLSICIPTYNRAHHLADCLHSIALNHPERYPDFQVCVSDNCSTDDTVSVIEQALQQFNFKYNRNEKNLGRVRNYLRVVEMAEGEFVWFLGDDDLLLPDALDRLFRVFACHAGVDYFYVNAFHLTTEYVETFPRPFDTANLPADMEPFSKRKESGAVPFLRLVDPEVSFDFLGGFFLAVFRRERWSQYADILDQKAISDLREFSHYDNTFPHVKIFARAFAHSRAYFHAEPLSVCLTGAREWSPMYPFVRSVRLVESLHEFRKNGLPFMQYLRCKNFALNNFAVDFALMLILKRESGITYINPWKLIMQNCLFPNFYLSVFYSVARKLKSCIKAGNEYFPVKSAAGTKEGN